MNSPKLLAAFSLLLAVVVYVRFVYEPIDWKDTGPPQEAADDWLTRRAGNDRLRHLNLHFPSDQTLEGWKSAGTMKAVEWFSMRSKHFPPRYAAVPDPTGLREIRHLPHLRQFYCWFVEFPGDSFTAIGEWASLEEATIHYPGGVTPAHVAALGRLSRLKDLTLLGVLVDEGTTRALAGCTSLEHLEIREAQLEDAALRHVGGVRSLKFLHLGSNRIQGAGLAGLAGLDQLGILWLEGNPLEDEQLRALPSLPQLGIVDLKDTPISDAGLAGLPDLPRLHNLDLGGTRVTDDGLRHLRRFPQLSRLTLPAGVRGPGVRVLHELPNLVSVSFEGAVPDEALDALRRAIPAGEFRGPD